jgi:hypothetical protein
MRSGFDTLAAYEDRSARYINFSGAAIIWEAPDSRMDGLIRDLLGAGEALAELLEPREGSRPPLVSQQGRISLLTPSGLLLGEASFEALAGDSIAGPIISAAAALMQSLMRAAESSRGDGLTRR